MEKLSNDTTFIFPEEIREEEEAAGLMEVLTTLLQTGSLSGTQLA